MNKPHKHAEIIKAWADGAEIEFSYGNEKWHQIDKPTWDPFIKYRVKPENSVLYYNMYSKSIGNYYESIERARNASDGPIVAFLKVTRNTEQNKILSVEVIDA